MNKPLVLIQSPVDTHSGYGSHSRDIIKSLFKLHPDWEYKFISLRWGNTPQGALNDNDLDEKRILDNILRGPELRKQPDYFIQISVPNEFHPVGKYNIGITAGIESNAVSVPWIEGMNKMDLVLVPSKHSKDVFLATQWDNKSPDGNVLNIIKVNKPIEILFEGVNTDIFKEIKWVD